MAKITQIKQNVKNKNKASVFADGEFLCSVTCESIVNGRLKEGDEIDEAKLKLVLEESEKQLAFQKGVESVCRNLKTQKQIEEMLTKKGYSPEIVKSAVEKMKEYRYVDDEEYVRCFCETYKNAKGKKRIKYELKLKGICDEHLVLIDEFIDSQEEAVFKAAEKFMKNRNADKDTLQKLFRHLAGKGFEFDLCRKAVENFSSDEVGDDF